MGIRQTPHERLKMSERPHRRNIPVDTHLKQAAFLGGTDLLSHPFTIASAVFARCIVCITHRDHTTRNIRSDVSEAA